MLGVASHAVPVHDGCVSRNGEIHRKRYLQKLCCRGSCLKLEIFCSKNAVVAINIDAYACINSQVT